METTVRTAAVITVSDSASRGERQDESGPLLVSLLREAGFEVRHAVVVPDDRARIAARLRALALEGVHLVATTGGTGLGPRDVTPEATRDVIEREIPGIGEAMRASAWPNKPHAMLSRQTAGIRGQTLIVNFPGSPRAVEEGFRVIAPILRHALDLVAGITEHRPN
ncbi:MogA/MoaB family molybdenum cofactor biosynthesis protein [Alicyclobacillus acidocaldarius]|uniref:Molybdenum cofactor synthesis domain protein n=1 Tax=Alicyclobacillus acidocaldarius subsp. acidocaldarius (strain ATCC 27009 / DSM 446 / BCRC 14685 / JCM 5260 / KCTC 1825 / NBRC 15652 / NCIMB 11725 / NRRL B-14509 / 104-IA) TaxID=521098 RepID=C8WT70_ALIAD|nr:MogA/MoaB family molybdenum cofactor biosynthesis protein [Alicyclobacillus acidocaldarius]ACV59584.1 molybdenum cofactor synthesis domain protein [Alicyclobacillus acidocaldarius subsp. acidocaldarius DSM 446]